MQHRGFDEKPTQVLPAEVYNCNFEFDLLTEICIIATYAMLLSVFPISICSLKNLTIAKKNIPPALIGGSRL